MLMHLERMVDLIQSRDKGTLRTMTIQVEMVDGTFCRVVPKGLNLLLNRELVKRFRRSSGWAVVGQDPIRYPDKGINYQGPERRVAA